MKQLLQATSAFVLTAMAATTVDASSWQRVTGAGDVPSGRTTPSVAAVDGYVYLFGGLRDDFAAFTNDFFNDLYRFDPQTQQWVELAPAGTLPPARTFASTAVHDDLGLMLVFGGSVFDPSFQTFQVFDDLWSYSPEANVWDQVVATNQGPSARSGAVMWFDDDEVYVFGGITQFFEFRNDLWSYDFETNTWTELIAQGAAGSPPGRHVMATGSETEHGQFTIYGGEALDFSTFEFVMLEDVWQLDIDTLQWTNATPTPAQDLTVHRNYGAAETVGDRLVFHGGDIPGGSTGCGAPFPQNVSDETWSYDLEEHSWLQEQPLGDPAPRLKRTAAAVVDEKMYVFGGWDFQCPNGTGPGQVFSTDVWVFDADEDSDDDDDSDSDSDSDG